MPIGELIQSRPNSKDRPASDLRECKKLKWVEK
jgi:hypothetical protein